MVDVFFNAKVSGIGVGLRRFIMWKGNKFTYLYHIPTLHTIRLRTNVFKGLKSRPSDFDLKSVIGLMKANRADKIAHERSFNEATYKKAMKVIKEWDKKVEREALKIDQEMETAKPVKLVRRGR